MFAHRLRPRILLASIILSVVALGPALPAQAATLCYPLTGQCTGQPFTDFWQGNGGLSIFGFPVTTVAPETNPDTSATYLTQWFERERLERHPANAAPYTVQLGRLGAQRLAQQGRDWTTFPKATPSTPHYFAVTGHAIAPQFWDYWRSHGLDFDDAGVSARESLALFGYPLSEPAMETNTAGDRVLTQWFERARFEYHPDKPQPYTVLLGLLGSELRPTGIPAAIPSYENRTASPVEFLVSYYNAINRKDYPRAYSYWERIGSGQPGVPTDYASFAQGFADTAYVAVTLGEARSDAGAGNIYGTVPIVIVATHTDGRSYTFAGCYITHHTNQGIDPDPTAVLWKLNRATITAAPSNSSPATLLPGQNCQP